MPSTFPMLGVIVHPVGRFCNLNCAYCFYTEDERRFHVAPMAPEIRDRLIRDALTCAEEYCAFYWHGGEPTLAGLPFYRHVVELQARYRRPGQIVENLTQTNGTRLTPEWAQFYREHEFGVGVSIDGSARTHDLHRKDWGGHGTWQRVLAGIRLLQDTGVSFGVIGTITRQTCSPEEILEKVRTLQALGITSMAFNYCHEVDPRTGDLTPQSVTADEFARSVGVLFDYWSDRDDPALDIREVDSHIAPLIGQVSHSSRMSGRCECFITVDRDGNVSPCDCFGASGGQPFSFGTLRDSTLAEILCGQAASAFRDSVARKLYPECATCEWFRACRGGCVYERYFYDRMRGRRQEFCDMRKRIFEHVLGRLEEAVGAAAR